MRLPLRHELFHLEKKKAVIRHNHVGLKLDRDPFIPAENGTVDHHRIQIPSVSRRSVILLRSAC